MSPPATPELLTVRGSLAANYPISASSLQGSQNFLY